MAPKSQQRHTLPPFVTGKRRSGFRRIHPRSLQLQLQPSSMATSLASSPIKPSPQTKPYSPPRPSAIDWASTNTLLQHQPQCNGTALPSPSLHSIPPTCTLTKPQKIPKYPQHTCFHGANCCIRFSGEGPLHAADFNHLPVCHNGCWKRERDRLEKEARDASAGDRTAVLRRVPICHRECYMRGLGRVEGPPNAEREVVPLNRCLGEVLRLP